MSISQHHLCLKGKDILPWSKNLKWSTKAWTPKIIVIHFFLPSSHCYPACKTHSESNVCLCTKDHPFLHLQEAAQYSVPTVASLLEVVLVHKTCLVQFDGYIRAITALLIVKNCIILWCLLCTRCCSRSNVRKLLLGPHSKYFRLCRTDGLCHDYWPLLLCAVWAQPLMTATIDVAVF